MMYVKTTTIVTNIVPLAWWLVWKTHRLDLTLSCFLLLSLTLGEQTHASCTELRGSEPARFRSCDAAIIV